MSADLQQQQQQQQGGITAAPPSSHLAMSNFNQKAIERKEQELRDLVLANYTRIRDVERELSQLQLQVKLTSGPKRQALELMRKKIEVQGEKVAGIRQRYTAAKEVFLSVEAELKKEEEEKDKLCDELNMLIQQSTALQMSKLEELRLHLEMLNQGMAPNLNPGLTQNPTQHQHQHQGMAPNPNPGLTAANQNQNQNQNPFASPADARQQQQPSAGAPEPSLSNGQGQQQQLPCAGVPEPVPSSGQPGGQQQQQPVVVLAESLDLGSGAGRRARPGSNADERLHPGEPGSSGSAAAAEQAAAASGRDAAAAVARSRHVSVGGSRAKPAQQQQQQQQQPESTVVSQGAGRSAASSAASVSKQPSPFSGFNT